MSHKKLGFYLLVFFFVVPLTMLIHEGGHFLSGEILGNPMEMDLNNSRPVHGYYLEPWHSPIVAAFGSVFSLGQAFFFWLILKRKNSIFLYPFLFFPGFYRALPYVITMGDSQQRILQDKGQVSFFLGVSPWVLILPYLFIIIYLVFSGSRKLKVKWQLNLLSVIFSFLLTVLWLQINHML